MSQQPSVVVFGPQGCGKTHNAENLRRHYGLAEVIELDEVGPVRLPRNGALILTCSCGAGIEAGPGFRLVAFDAAMADLKSTTAAHA